MPLLVRLDKADLDRMKKAIEVLRWVLLSHGADSSTNSLYRKEHSAKRIAKKHGASWDFGFLKCEII
jgi:hypothetical protein